MNLWELVIIIIKKLEQLVSFLPPKRQTFQCFFQVDFESECGSEADEFIKFQFWGNEPRVSKQPPTLYAVLPGVKKGSFVQNTGQYQRTTFVIGSLDFFFLQYQGLCRIVVIECSDHCV